MADVAAETNKRDAFLSRCKLWGMMAEKEGRMLKSWRCSHTPRVSVRCTMGFRERPVSIIS